MHIRLSQHGAPGRLVEFLPALDLGFAAPATEAYITLELAQLDAGILHRTIVLANARGPSIRHLLFIQAFVRLFSIVLFFVLLG